MIIVYQATTRRHLIAAAKLPRIQNATPLDYQLRALPFRVSLPCCGRVREWPSINDIPKGDVGPCPCGNWFIRYTEKVPS